MFPYFISTYFPPSLQMKKFVQKIKTDDHVEVDDILAVSGQGWEMFQRHIEAYRWSYHVAVTALHWMIDLYWPCSRFWDCLQMPNTKTPLKALYVELSIVSVPTIALYSFTRLLRDLRREIAIVKGRLREALLHWTVLYYCTEQYCKEFTPPPSLLNRSKA